MKLAGVLYKVCREETIDGKFNTDVILKRPFLEFASSFEEN